MSRGARAYSRWDRLVGYDRAGASFAAVARTAPFDEWHRNPDRERPGELTRLRVEYWRRRAHWEARLAIPPEHDDLLGRWWPVLIPALGLPGLIAAGYWPLAGVVLLVSAFGVPALVWHATRRPRTLARALLESRCPDCWYDLAGTTVLEPESLEGGILGPVRCPECGAPWPLVPPAVGASSPDGEPPGR